MKTTVKFHESQNQTIMVALHFSLIRVPTVTVCVCVFHLLLEIKIEFFPAKWKETARSYRTYELWT